MVIGPLLMDNIIMPMIVDLEDGNPVYTKE